MSEGKQIYYHNLRENLRKMNPRFKELAIQAGAYEDGDSILTGPMDVAKFAELIVRKCADVLVAEMNRLDGLDRVVASQTMDTAQVLIKQHFGVEE